MAVFKRSGSPNYQVEFLYRGHRTARSARTTSRREAEAFERQLRDQVAKDVAERRTGPSLTLDQACGRYWDRHAHKLADARNVQRWLLYVTRFIPDDLPLRDLSTRHVADMVAAMETAGIGRISINRTITCLQGVHNMAAKRWEEAVKVVNWKPHKSRERGRTRAITIEEAQRLLDSLPTHIRRVVLFLLTTGLRRTEAFELLWARVNFEAGTANVRVKGGIDREVELSPEALAVLHETPREGRFVFDTTNYRKHFEAALRAAEISDFRWHDLRHTFATWLGQSGAPLDVIRDQFGHSSISVTQKYRHVARPEVRAALQKLPTISPNSTNVVGLKRR